MSIEDKIIEQDIFALWKQFKAERESFLNARDSMDRLLKKIKKTNFSELSDQTEKDLFTDMETKINAIS